jgi:(E)-4-hydroxy-3-methylbut-2-enyl-diphosphate synthase
VTEAGTLLAGSVKSSVALAVLLSRGIGDTIRVSLTGPPVEEVRVAYMILASLGLRERQGVEIISCPTCGRCEWSLEKTAAEIESQTRNIRVPLKVAVMGCAVNGPGEAKHADIGVAGGQGQCLLFKKGQVLDKIPEGQVVEVLLREIREMTKEKINN